MQLAKRQVFYKKVKKTCEKVLTCVNVSDIIITETQERGEKNRNLKIR